MRMPARLIYLTEYETRSLPAGVLPEAAALRLAQRYGAQVTVTPPSFFNDHRWVLTARGWVGTMPLTGDLGLVVEPKAPLDNIFAMLAYAYDLRSFRFIEGLTTCASLLDVYERLAGELARRVLTRARKGLGRAYAAREGRMPYVTGRLDVVRDAARPWEATFYCHYGHPTPDVEDNQILLWTLRGILRSGLCTERTLPELRRAYRALRGAVTLRPFDAEACAGRVYHRLNEDYRAMHALCRFFLAHSGPTHEPGDDAALPFVVNMAALYERFVATWLADHLSGSGVRVQAQERVPLGREGAHHFEVDLTLYEAATDRTLAVIDTKYKAAARPATEDVAQVVAYAEARRCAEAVLVYPVMPAHSLDAMVGDIHVRTLAFLIEGDLDAAGRHLIAQLGLADPEPTTAMSGASP
jgi:5-methylcytosine-specific restriction enzyme subunit McrC